MDSDWKIAFLMPSDPLNETKLISNNYMTWKKFLEKLSFEGSDYQYFFRDLQRGKLLTLPFGNRILVLDVSSTNVTNPFSLSMKFLSSNCNYTFFLYFLLTPRNAFIGCAEISRNLIPFLSEKVLWSKNCNPKFQKNAATVRVDGQNWSRLHLNYSLK